MPVIPVIDLKQGQVVHAVRGQREHYQPVAAMSRLCRSSELRAVIEAFLTLHPFKYMYIADLDAITGSGGHAELLARVLPEYPVEFWLDQGLCLSRTPRIVCDYYKTVLGTESQQFAPAPALSNFILSLDYNGPEALGRADWFSDSRYWPRQVIAMNLSRVGGGGPDWELLRRLKVEHTDRELIAAGGVRDDADLRRLENLGVWGVLAATGLHTGSIQSGVGLFL